MIVRGISDRALFVRLDAVGIKGVGCVGCFSLECQECQDKGTQGQGLYRFCCVLYELGSRFGLWCLRNQVHIRGFRFGLECLS